MPSDPRSHSPNLLMDAEAIEQLRHHWQEFISGLEKTPTELQLSKARADRALELARSNRNGCSDQASSSLKNVRPLTALYNSPRITCRMKKILRALPTKSEELHEESHYNLCPRCGLVRDRCLTHEKHAEQTRQRLNKLLAQHPYLLPYSQR